MQEENEVVEIAARLLNKHGPALSQAACLVNLTEALFTSAGLLATPQMSALLKVQREAVGAWLENQGLPAGGLCAAVLGLQQGTETARYLSALPA